jgi:4'-phosphopantetheinyl transferase
LRTVLGRCLGISPEKVRFIATGASGAKPSLEAGQSNSDFRFNLSHTAGAALIGVAIGREIGIDVEWHRPMEDLHGMARSVMSEEELRQWSVLSVPDQTPAFYHLWTRKEAYLKAIGLGLYRSLQDVTVPVSADPLGALPEGSSIVRDRSGTGLWRVGDVPAAEGYSASVCWEGDGVAALVMRDLVRDGLEWLS